MDKSRMTFTFHSNNKDAPGPKRDLRDRRPFVFVPRSDGKKVQVQNIPWFIPALLAVATGIVLGLGVLFLFKNSAPAAQPSVTTVNPSPQGGAATTSSVQTLPGMDFMAYQVGVYSDNDSAKKGAAELEKIGLHPVFRNSDKVQLFIGIALDKTQGQGIVTALQQVTNQEKPLFYAREYKIEQRKGSMNGVSSKDAVTLTGVLTQGAQIMQDGVPLSLTNNPGQEAIMAWNNRIQALKGQMDLARKILEKAEKKGEMARLDDIFIQLQASVQSLAEGKDVLTVQQHLVQSIVDYEELIAKLIPAVSS